MEEIGPCARMVSQRVNLVTRRFFATTMPLEDGSWLFVDGP